MLYCRLRDNVRNFVAKGSTWNLELLEDDTFYKVSSVSMGQSSTSIYLELFPGKSFNSVLFQFFKEHDIYTDPEYNPYLKE